jgi:hypothetical protein
LCLTSTAYLNRASNSGAIPGDVLILGVFVKKEEAVLKEPMFYGIVDQLLQKSVQIPC